MLVPVTFVNQIFRNFGWNDNVKSFFCIVGTSWMGWGRVEWYWQMGMSYLTSLNAQLSKNIAYVGSFKHFSVQLFLHVFCKSTKTSANSSVIELGDTCKNGSVMPGSVSSSSSLTLRCLSILSITERFSLGRARDGDHRPASLTHLPTTPLTSLQMSFSLPLV